jgi:hypothetical protein
MGAMVHKALLVLSWSLCAAQAPTFTGTWQLNVDKSNWGLGTKPGTVYIVIDHREPELRYRGVVFYSSDETRLFEFAGAFDGKPYRVSRSFGDGYITLRRVDAYSYDSSFQTDNGLYTEKGRTSLSRDGRTLTRKLTVRSLDGVQSWTEVYDRR